MSTITVVAHSEKLAKKDAKALRRAFKEAGFTDVGWINIEKGSDAKSTATKAVKQGATTIVVCGGDGSVRAAAEAIVGTPTALCVVPCGTANLFASGLEFRPTSTKSWAYSSAATVAASTPACAMATCST